MKRRWFSVLGVLLVATGFLLLLNYFQGITGFVVFEGAGKSIGGIVGVLMVLIGAAILVSSEVKHRRGLQAIDEALRSGRAGTYREAERMALNLGYRIEEGGNHKTVYDEKNQVVTQIPRHGGDAPTGLYRAILKKLKEHED